MKLVANWRAVLMRAWSVRFVVLAAVFTAFEVAMPFLAGYLPIPQTTFAVLAGLSSAAALVARVVAQKNVSGE